MIESTYFANSSDIMFLMSMVMLTGALAIFAFIIITIYNTVRLIATRRDFAIWCIPSLIFYYVVALLALGCKPLTLVTITLVASIIINIVLRCIYRQDITYRPASLFRNGDHVTVYTHTLDFSNNKPTLKGSFGYNNTEISMQELEFKVHANRIIFDDKDDSSTATIINTDPDLSNTNESDKNAENNTSVVKDEKETSKSKSTEDTLKDDLEIKDDNSDANKDDKEKDSNVD